MKEPNPIKLEGGKLFINDHYFDGMLGLSEDYWQRIIRKCGGQLEIVLLDKPQYEGVWQYHAFLTFADLDVSFASGFLLDVRYRGHCTELANAGQLSTLIGAEVPYLNEPVKNISADSLIVFYDKGQFVLVTSDLSDNPPVYKP